MIPFVPEKMNRGEELWLLKVEDSVVGHVPVVLNVEEKLKELDSILPM